MGLYILEYGGNAVGAVGTVVACASSGPAGWFAGAAMMLAGATGEAESLHEGWEGQWPGERTNPN